MQKTFKAEKMLKRIQEEGRGYMLDKETVARIKALDGMTGNDYNWRAVVYNENVVLLEDGTYVNGADCD